MTGLSLGIDVGTSGIRTAVVDAAGDVVSTARSAFLPQEMDANDATIWWARAADCLAKQIAALREDGVDPKEIARIGVDGTSGSMVLTDAALRPVTRALMYNSGGFEKEAALIASLAPDPHITHGSNSALARALRLQSEDVAGHAVHLLHQADFVAARLMGQGGLSDHNNALKTGYDPETQSWPDWIGALGFRGDLLPEILPAGAAARVILPDMAEVFGLSGDVMIHVGTTDSIAAFLAAAPLQIGAAVTSLGTTLAVKLLSDRRIDAPEIGLYSHRLDKGWLVGGASNSGGGVLRKYFSTQQLAALSTKIDASTSSTLDYYPLPSTGERFPINDPCLEPRMSPRPADDAAFLYGLLEGIAHIEARCYEEMQSRGAPPPTSLFTAGGGAENPTWTAIRTRVLGRPIHRALHSEAAIGTAKLIASQG